MRCGRRPSGTPPHTSDRVTRRAPDDCRQLDPLRIQQQRAFSRLIARGCPVAVCGAGLAGSAPLVLRRYAPSRHRCDKISVAAAVRGAERRYGRAGCSRSDRRGDRRRLDPTRGAGAGAQVAMSDWPGSRCHRPRAAVPAVEGESDRDADADPDRRGRDRHGRPFAQPPRQRHRVAELQHRPAPLGGDPAQAAVRIDRGRVPDRLQQRHVGDRVRVRVARGAGRSRAPWPVARTASALVGPAA